MSDWLRRERKWQDVYPRQRCMRVSRYWSPFPRKLHLFSMANGDLIQELLKEGPVVGQMQGTPVSD
jgi:hypothetical protein